MFLLNNKNNYVSLDLLFTNDSLFVNLIILILFISCIYIYYYIFCRLLIKYIFIKLFLILISK